MLLTFERLRAKPPIFKAFTGVSVGDFETLLTQSTPLSVEREQQRLTRSNRQRALGGGCKPKFGLRDQLLVTLVWLRLYLTTETLGFLFGIDKATVSRYTRAILPVLRQVGDGTLGWPEAPKRGQGKDWRRRGPPTPIYLPSWTPRSSPCNGPGMLNAKNNTTPARKNATPAKSRLSSMSTASYGRSATRYRVPCMTANFSASPAPPRRFPRRRSQAATPVTKGFKTIYPITA